MRDLIQILDITLLKQIGLSIAKLFIVMLIFMAIDMGLGVTRARFINHDFKSSKLKDGIYKDCIYFFCLLLSVTIAWWMPTVAIWGKLNLAQVIIVIIIITELTSIVENTKDIPVLYNTLKSILDKLKEVFDFLK